MTETVSALPSHVAEDRSADHRTRHLLEAPILPLLVRLAWPNVLIMIAQASTGLIETWWVAKLGTDALAGMALVFPAVMLMTTISSGALGGAISSAVARALGARKQSEANAVILYAIAINVAFGLAFSALFLLAGRPIFSFLGGSGPSLEAALIYSNVVFAGNVIAWLMNGLASVIRGTGNMLFPATVTCLGAAFLVPVSPVLIFGFGPIPALDIAGGGVALVAFYLTGTLAMAWHIWTGRNPVRFEWTRLRWRPMAGILRIGTLSSLNSIQNNVVISGATALVATYAGMDAVAGFGTGVRLEYLLIPLVFGIGAPMVAMVGTNIGAGQSARALKVALAGAGLAFAVTEAIGLAAAFFPTAWLNLFSVEPATIAAGSAYLRLVGPFYGFFGLGLVLYFASQGADRLLWPLVAGFLRVLIALGGGWVALWLGAPLSALFVALGLGLLVYGLTIFAAVRSGMWLR